MPLIIGPEGPGRPLPAASSVTGSYSGDDADWTTSPAGPYWAIAGVTITGTCAPGAMIVGTGPTTAVWMVPDPGYAGDLCLGLPEL